MGDAGRTGNPQILTELRSDLQPWNFLAVEEEIHAKGDHRAEPLDGFVSGRELPALIELIIGRQIFLRDEAEESATVQNGGHVVQLSA